MVYTLDEIAQSGGERMKADRCPVCYGTGKYTPPQNPFSTAVATPQTCHGCGGLGWVQVAENKDELKKGRWKLKRL